MATRPHRIAARALILHDDRLLLVNAYPDGQSNLWCAPGGGANPHVSLPENLRREVLEETGLNVAVGAPCLVNEFHAPDRDFHQIDIYFRCRIEAAGPGAAFLDPEWRDPEGIVTKRQFLSRAQMENIHFKPDSLPDVAWDTGRIHYDPLEILVR